MKETRDICGKVAVGIQCLGCCSVAVREDHAEGFLKGSGQVKRKDRRSAITGGIR